MARRDSRSGYVIANAHATPAPQSCPTICGPLHTERRDEPRHVARKPRERIVADVARPLRQVVPAQVRRDDAESRLHERR